MSIDAPNKIDTIPEKAQWVGGIGAGSWFVMTSEKKDFRIKRFSPEGILECSRIFYVKNTEFNINKPYEFTYMSHCKECTIIQDEQIFKFYQYFH